MTAFASRDRGCLEDLLPFARHESLAEGRRGGGDAGRRHGGPGAASGVPGAAPSRTGFRTDSQRSCRDVVAARSESRSRARAGSNYRVGEALSRSLKTSAGYELELVETTSPGNVDSRLSATERIDLATALPSADDEAVRVLVWRVRTRWRWKALEHFSVVVANDDPGQGRPASPRAACNPGIRPAERPADARRARARLRRHARHRSRRLGRAGPTVARPDRGNLQDLDSGHNIATTRTQFLSSASHRPHDCGPAAIGACRFATIRRSRPCCPARSQAPFSPGLYGPRTPRPRRNRSRTIAGPGSCSWPGPTSPGRVVRDILEVVYSPRFERDVNTGSPKSLDVIGWAAGPSGG